MAVLVTNQAEDTLFASLSDTDRIEVLAREGLPLECIPTEEMRQVVEWAIEQYLLSNRTKAPSREALLETWGQVLEDAEVELIPEDEEIDNIGWAIQRLKDRYVQWVTQDRLKEIAMEMANAGPNDQISTLSREAAKFGALALKMQSGTEQTEGIQAFRDSLVEYQARVETGQTTYGMTFGLPEIDEHTHGLHPGEIGIWAAASKGGKSWTLAKIALHEWRQCGRIVTLFTLENTLPLTRDRLVCIELGIPWDLYARGECTDEQVRRIHDFLEEYEEPLRDRLHIIRPTPERSTPIAIVQQAQLLGTDSLFVDQLTHVTPVRAREKRTDEVRQNMSDFHKLLTMGGHPMPLLMAHQVNREGIKAAMKLDRLEMIHMAETSEVERTATIVYGLMANEEEQRAGLARLQTLASRRTKPKTWQLVANPGLGVFRVMKEI